MMSSSQSEEQIIRYLLDEMSAEERSSVEEHLSRDAAFFELISSVEDDLIMQYVRGDLEDRLLPRFTEVYLNSPARRARVDRARLLQRAVRDAAQSRKPGMFRKLFFPEVLQFRLAIVSVAAGIILAAVFILPTLWKPKPSSQQHPQKNISQISFSLQPGLVRGEAGMQIAIPPGTRQVKFDLLVPSPPAHENYRALLETPEQAAIWSGTAVPKGAALVAIVPAEALAAGDYTLRLQIAEAGANWKDAAIYSFRVAK